MKKALITSAILIALSGCGSTTSGTKEFDTAIQLASVNQFDEAIAYLKQAVGQDPDNEKYVAKLADVKARYIQVNLKKVNQLLTGDATKAKLDEAESLIKDLEKVGIKNNSMVQATDLINTKRSDLYSQLSEVYEKAKMAMDTKNWGQAHSLLSDIASRFENYEDVQSRLKTSVTEANKYYLGQANTAIKNDQFALARQHLSDLLNVIPNNPIALSLLKKVERNDNQEYFLAKVKIAQQTSDWSEVIKNCEMALSYRTGNNQCRDLLVTAKQKQAQFIANSILESMTEGRLIEAKSLYLELKNLNALDTSKLENLRDSLSQQAEYTADTYKQNGRYAIALVLLKTINEINPAYPDLFTKIRTVEDNIYGRARRSIAVFDFNSPSSSDDAGVIVANNLISRLFNNASSDIKILERENLKSILEEMKLGQIGVVSETTAKEMGRIYGIDYAIMGSVLLYKVDENTASSTKTIRYEIGKKIEDNIEYLNWKAVNPDPSKKELRAAPLAKIMVPEYGEKEYDVTQTKKVGFLQLSFRIVNVLTGENTRVDTIERKIQIEDTSNAGVQDAGIKFDPMEVPTDTEIMQQLTEQIVEHMAGEVLRPLQQLETYYFNEGQDRERRAELDIAVEYYTYAIYNEKLKSVSASPTTIEAKNRINNILARYRFNTN
ncbi:CsgG/HfaB family protein [Paraglaciecola sp. L3A3]|uniref:CsgG/HfaB family protein n=1 Tax=Paraglaciecola sp. L3A3 TaxID=2686358 RepID=UPI00131DCA91|nr:CsgG/HfaB family protein [Paraglaciecola sp. L3A3]